MRIRYAIPDAALTPDVLNAALETSTRANEELIKRDLVPDNLAGVIRRGRIRWRPERFKDGEHFDLAPDVARRGWGDCDDLAPWLAAELRATGRDRGARAVAKRSGPQRWHALVRTSAGRMLDPSKWAGMLRYYALRGRGVQKPMAVRGESALGIKRYRGGWLSRCDLPIADTRMHVSGLGVSDDLETAISDAMTGATLVGETSGGCHRYHLARAAGLHAAVVGDDDELTELEDETDVGFLPLAASLVPGALNLAKGLIPGGGGGGKPAPAPGAPALAATPSGGGGPVSVTPYGPGGPVIVRF